MGWRCQRKSDRCNEILLLELAKIAEFHRRTQSYPALIHYSKEVRDEFCETDIALNLRVAVRRIFCNYFSC